MSGRLWVLAATLLAGAGCRSANGKDAAPPPRAGVADAAARAEQPSAPADAGTQAPAKDAPKTKKHGGAKPPAPTPTPNARYRCSRTYCDESGRCVSPSPPNCVP
jgi:hypothetical protein